MSKLVADMSMSLDGFIAGPNDRPGQALGEGGERLHQWMEARQPAAPEPSSASVNGPAIAAELFAATGAIIMGRRWFDNGESPWGDDPPFHLPCFILTHEAREPLVKRGGTTYTFVTTGIRAALEQARAAGGTKDVWVSGASTIVQYLQAGLLDQLHIHLIPVLLGSGRPLFDNLGPGPIELQLARVRQSPGATHLLFEVRQ
jgi:dihydrofolate reductase